MNLKEKLIKLHDISSPIYSDEAFTDAINDLRCDKCKHWRTHWANGKIGNYCTELVARTTADFFCSKWEAK